MDLNGDGSHGTVSGSLFEASGGCSFSLKKTYLCLEGTTSSFNEFEVWFVPGGRRKTKVTSFKREEFRL